MSADNFPYVEGQPAEIYFDGKWHRGKIIAGYRFRDCTDGRWEENLVR